MSSAPKSVALAYDAKAIKDAEVEALADLKAARLLAITCDDDFKWFAEQAIEVKKQIKATEEARFSVTRPLDAAKKALDALFAPRRNALAELDRYIGSELQRWQMAKRDEQRKQMAAAAAAANARDTQGITTALAAVQAAAPVKVAGVSIREVWHAEIVDAAAVPRDWCVPDVKAIAKAAKDTPITREPAPIAGVVFTRVGASRITT